MKNQPTTAKPLTKKELDAMYQRPERYVGERLSALMGWAIHELQIIGKKETKATVAPISFPGAAAKTLLLALLFGLFSFGFMGCTKQDKCASTICQNGGMCREGKCFCETGYEGTRCEVAMREKFKGTWNGTLDDGTGPSNFTIVMGYGTSATQLTFAFDVILVNANVVSSRDLAIPNQSINYSGSIMSVAGSGSCPSDNHLLLDFIIIWPDGTSTGYHFVGSK